MLVQINDTEARPAIIKQLTTHNEIKRNELPQQYAAV